MSLTVDRVTLEDAKVLLTRWWPYHYSFRELDEGPPLAYVQQLAEILAAARRGGYEG